MSDTLIIMMHQNYICYFNRINNENRYTYYNEYISLKIEDLSPPNSVIQEFSDAIDLMLYS